MAKKEVEKAALKSGQRDFTIRGSVVRTDDSFSGAILEEGKTWKHVNSSFGVEKSEGVTPFVRLWGGYKTDKNEFSVRKKDDMTKRMTVAVKDRNEKTVLDQVHPQDFYVAGIEKEESGKIIRKRFISPLDFEAYLDEHLENGMPITVRGDVEYSEYNDETYRRYNVRTVFLNEGYTKDDVKHEPKKNVAQIKQTVLLTQDSLPKKWQASLDKGESIAVSAFVPQYLSSIKVGESYQPLKETIAMAISFFVHPGKDVERTKKIVSKFLAVKKGKVREMVAILDINEGYDTASGGELELDEALQELVDLGYYSEEEIKESVVVRGNKINELIFVKPAIRRDNETGTIILPINDDKYDETVLARPSFDDEDDEDLDDDELDALTSDDDSDDDGLDGLFD